MHKSGAVKSTVEYREGFKNGPYYEWFSDGRPAAMGLFSSGTKVGQWTTWAMAGGTKKTETVNKNRKFPAELTKLLRPIAAQEGSFGK